MPGEDDGDGPRGQLPPFTPPRFNWNQDNLYEQIKNFKRVVEFTFKGQYEKCSDSIKCGSILNWLGVEAYPIYNLSINEDDKKDLSKLLDAFERYFKPERNVFQSWYTLGSIYSSAFKTQLELYHKLNSVANDITNITITDLSQKAEAMEAIEVIADLNLGSLVLVQIVVPVTRPGSVKPMAKNVFTATERDISVNYVIPDSMENLQVQG